MGRPLTAGRRHARGFAIGAVLAGIVFFWMLTAGTFDPGHRVPFSGNFYDVQAHRILEGHLSMPPDVLSIEGYEHDGNWYMYFGPAPALLRLPTAAISDSFDGHTGVPSMSLAFVVAMVSLGLLSWRVRRWTGAREGDDGEDADPVDGCDGFDRCDEVLAAVTAFVLGVGTTIVFVGVGPYVYHEAIMWGVALAFAAFAAILSWVETPRSRTLLVAALLTMLALLSRFAVGLGPAAALALLALVYGLARIWPRARRLAAHLGLADDAVAWRTVGWLAAAFLVPLGVYAVVNLLKFGTLFSVPYDHQGVNALVAGRKEVLAANNGTLLNVKALPTNLVQYLRPDAFRLDGSWPWVRLPSGQPHVFGDLKYDLLDHTSSVTVTMPLLLVLGLGGIVAMARAAARSTVATLRSLSVPALGAVAAGVPTLVFVYITERYIADFLPVLVLCSFAGFHAFVRWARGARERRGLAITASVVLAALALWGCVANVSIARDYQLGREQVKSFDQRS